MTECQRCETRMTYNDETTRITEYTCPTCHNTTVVWKAAHRSTA